MKRVNIFTLTVLATVATVLLPAASSARADTRDGGHTPAAADASAIHASWDDAALWLMGTPPLYGGVSAHDVTCLLEAGSVDCGWEIAFALRDGALCAIGLVGVGKAVMAWRLKKKLEKLGEATKAKNARGRAVIYAIVGLLVGDCLDFAASLSALLDCWEVTQHDRPMGRPRGFGPPLLQMNTLA